MFIAECADVLGIACPHIKCYHMLKIIWICNWSVRKSYHIQYTEKYSNDLQDVIIVILHDRNLSYWSISIAMHLCPRLCITRWHCPCRNISMTVTMTNVFPIVMYLYQRVRGLCPHLWVKVSPRSWASIVCDMMTSSNGNIFRITGHLCGEFTGPRWIPRTKASDAELWCFLWFAPE